MPEKASRVVVGAAIPEVAVLRQLKGETESLQPDGPRRPLGAILPVVDVRAATARVANLGVVDVATMEDARERVHAAGQQEHVRKPLDVHEGLALKAPVPLVPLWVGAAAVLGDVGGGETSGVSGAGFGLLTSIAPRKFGVGDLWPRTASAVI